MTVKIKDIDINILEVESLDNIIYVKDDEWQIGLYNEIQQTIYLYSKLSRVMKYKVLVHELVHAFIHIYNINICDEEHICEFVATYIKDIKKIADKYFMEVYE